LFYQNQRETKIQVLVPTSQASYNQSKQLVHSHGWTEHPRMDGEWLQPLVPRHVADNGKIDEVEEGVEVMGEQHMVS